MHKKFILFILLFHLSIFAKPHEFLLLGPAPYNPGFFSVFLSVIGFLDHYEKDAYAGMKIDFDKGGWYYDQAKGLNWWNYYFKPISKGTSRHAQVITLSAEWHGYFAARAVNELPAERKSELIRKYIHVRKSIRRKIDYFIKQYFEEDFVVGVHYRGTDKSLEAPRVSYETTIAVIQETIRNLKIKNFKIFVATDELDFLNFIKNSFPGLVIYTNSSRSSDGNALHTRLTENNYLKGEEALIDCLLLSKCHYLIRTSSNLSLCSTYFDPTLPILLINPGNFDKH